MKPKRRGVHKPTLLTPEVMADVEKALNMGAFRKTAAAWAGISYTTFREWLVYGEERPESEYGEFRRRVLHTEKDVEVQVGDVFLKAAMLDAKLAKEWLKLRYRKRWAPPTEVAVTGKGGEGLFAPLAEALEGISQAQLEAFARQPLPPEEEEMEALPEGEEEANTG